MIVDDFYVERIGSSPAETHSPLVVYANAMLTVSAAFEFLQSVGRRHAQVVEVLRTVKHIQLAKRNALDVPWKSPRNTPLPDDLCFSFTE